MISASASHFLFCMRKSRYLTVYKFYPISSTKIGVHPHTCKISYFDILPYIPFLPLYLFYMTDRIFILWSLILSFCITFLIMPIGIRLLKKYKIGKQIRDEALIGKAEEFARLHGAKTGTPTMWGVMILLSMGIMIWISLMIQQMSQYFGDFFGGGFKYSLWNRQETYIAIFTLFSVGGIGLIDDYMNVREIWRTKGLSARVKMILLSIFGLISAWWFYSKLWYHSVYIPLIGSYQLSYLYIPFFVFVFVALANSVNFTDWLDGLAGGLLLFGYSVYACITYVHGLLILTAFCLIIVWALIAFLWFNIHPAKVFMGDVWSLSLWSVLAIIAFMTDTLFALAVVSAIFIFEALSVVIQILSKRLRNGKKVFRIAPFHHHLEAIGWKEETIVMRLWLIGMIIAVAGLIVGLIR